MVQRNVHRHFKKWMSIKFFKMKDERSLKRYREGIEYVIHQKKETFLVFVEILFLIRVLLISKWWLFNDNIESQSIFHYAWLQNEQDEFIQFTSIQNKGWIRKNKLFRIFQTWWTMPNYRKCSRFSWIIQSKVEQARVLLGFTQLQLKIQLQPFEHFKWKFQSLGKTPLVVSH